MIVNKDNYFNKINLNKQRLINLNLNSMNYHQIKKINKPLINNNSIHKRSNSTTTNKYQQIKSYNLLTSNKINSTKHLGSKY